LKHFAIHAAEFSESNTLVQQLLKGNGAPDFSYLKEKKGVVFSEAVLEKFLEEDYRHGHSKLNDQIDRSIRTFSSGEKRKALLEHLLNQQPDFLVLDNPFDCLDRESVAMLKRKLVEISENVPIVQLLKRTEDLLPFIIKVFLPEERKMISVDDFLKLQKELQETDPDLFSEIPPAPGKYLDIPEVLVEMKNVCVNYDEKPILKNITWSIKKGEFWELSGPNGSGKTTLLDMIYGDNPKAYGIDLFLFGNRKGSGESVWDIKKKIGYFSPAITELFKGNHTLEQMLISGLVDSVGLYQKPSDKQGFLAQQWLRTLGLWEQRNKRFRSVSLLQQRMVLIARAMIKHPPLLILDEPSTALDEKSALELTKLINIFSEESGTTILYVSHRREKDLQPQFVLELTPSVEGSIAKVIKN
jgi:molybdate transport system ATP-binding protein